MRFIDSHCHYNLPELGEGAELEAKLDRALAEGVVKSAVVGSTMEDSREAIELCRRYGKKYGLFAVTGIHPHEVKELTGDYMSELTAMAENPLTRAWGEIGLDYYYDLSPRELQIRVLGEQLEAAKSLNKPVVFHVRDAYEDFWPMMTETLAPEKAELHCFTGSKEDLYKGLDRGWMFGVTGIVTFKRADDIRELVKLMPVENILCETDSPWMSPVPFRGKTNEPSRMPLIYRAVAEVKGMDVREFCEQIWENNIKFYNPEDK